MNINIAAGNANDPPRTVRLRNLNIDGTPASGAWTTFGNNRGLGNTNLGTAPTAAGGATSDLGQF